MEEYEVWYTRPDSGSVRDHVCVAKCLDRETARSIVTRVQRQVVIGGVVPGGLPDIHVYARPEGEPSWQLQLNGRVVRVRYTRAEIDVVHDNYVATLGAMRSYKCQLAIVRVDDQHFRPSTVDGEFLQRALPDDPLYGGGNDFIVRDDEPTPLHVIRPAQPQRQPRQPRQRQPKQPTQRTDDQILAIVANVDSAKLAKKLLRIDRVYWRSRVW